LGVGTGSELGAERTGVGDPREMLHGSSLIACGSFFSLSRLLKNPLSPRLLKKVQMPGGA